MSEEWRAVVGSDGRYEVSDRGRVRSFARSRTPSLMALPLNTGGYPSVNLSMGGRRIAARVHQLVLSAFVGPRPPGYEVRHLDGVNTNNRLSNLRYGTSSENARDSVTHGTNRQKRKTHCTKGHPYDGANTRVYQTLHGPDWRVCRTCRAAYMLAYRARRKESAA